MSKGSSSGAYLAAIVSATLMGMLGYFVRHTGCSAEGCAFVRFALGLVPVILLLLTVGKGRLGRTSMTSILSGLAISLCIFFYFKSIVMLPIGLACMLLYTGPVLAVVGEALLERRLPGGRSLVVLLVSVIGTALVLACGGGGAGAYSVTGLLFGFLSGAFYAAYILITRHISGVSLLQRTFWQLLAGAVVTGVLLYSTSGSHFSDWQAGWPFLLSIGLLQGFLVLLLVAYAVRHLRAVEYGAIAYLEPAVAVLCGMLLMGESMELLQWAGFVLVVGASLAQSLAPSRS